MIFKNTVNGTEITVTFTDADIIDVMSKRVPGMAALDPTLMRVQPELTEGEYVGGGINLIYSESTQTGEDIP